MKTYDAVIVGARCAGAATAMLLAQKGLTVRVIDRSALGRDTLSTHALMRGAVYQLDKWGVLDQVVAAGTPRIETTTFHYGEETIPVAIPEKFGTNALYAPRRTVLDPLLVRAAENAGAEVSYGQRLVDLRRDAAGRVTGVVCRSDRGNVQELRARIVIGADGARSTLAKLVGARTLRRFEAATSTIYGYFDDVPLDGYHWCYGDGVGAGTIPTNDNATGVFVAMKPERFYSHRGHASDLFDVVLRDAAPTIRESVIGRRRIGGFRRAAGMPSHMRACVGPGWALVGDAGYFKDPITAHGITDALRDAELLANAIVRGNEALASYQSLRDELSIPFFDTTRRVASMDWDLDGLKQLHGDLSRTMKREVEALHELNRGGARAA